MNNKYAPIGYVYRSNLPHRKEDDVIIETQGYLPAPGTKIYSEELVQELVERLQWYIDEDEYTPSDTWGSTFWAGKVKAIELLGRIE